MTWLRNFPFREAETGEAYYEIKPQVTRMICKKECQGWNWILLKHSDWLVESRSQVLHQVNERKPLGVNFMKQFYEAVLQRTTVLYYYYSMPFQLKVWQECLGWNYCTFEGCGFLHTMLRNRPLQNVPVAWSSLKDSVTPI